MFALAGCGQSTQPDMGVALCPNDLPACPSPAPSWKSTVLPIMNTRCISCHGPGGSDPSLPLNTYDEIYQRRGTILSETYACKMPPPDAGVLPPEGAERKILLEWLVCGAPDN